MTIVSSFWTMGSIFVAVLALFMFNENDFSWRIFVALCATPCLVGGTLVYFFVPESARFLALQNRPEEATKEANRLANAMGFTGPRLEVYEVRHHFNKQVVKLQDKRESTYSVVKNNMRNASKGVVALYSKSLRHVTITLQMLWFTLSFGTGVCTWINTIFQRIGLSNEYEQSLYFAVANIPGVIAAGLLLDRLGRKVFMLSSMVFASMSLLLFAQASKTTNIMFVNISACSFHIFLVTSWCTINVLTSELFPTSVRSTGLGVCAASGRIGSVLVQYVNGNLIEYPDKLLTVTSSVMLFGSCFLIFITDISNQPLKDSINHNMKDGEDQNLSLSRFDTEDNVVEML